ncbi:MAG TPA: efflux transporter periplasmic adaptor subunit, partial [Oscillatoriaceae cyanobacterium]
AVRMRPGMPATITQWGGDGVLTGTVRRIDPGGFTKVSALGVDEQRVDVTIALDAPPARLGDGYRVETHVVVWRSPAALMAPMSGLFRQGGHWCAFVVKDGRAHLQTVAIAHQTEDVAEVTGGLQAGEAIVNYPPDALRDGTAVAPERKAP